MARMARLSLFSLCVSTFFGLYWTQDIYTDRVSNYVYLTDLYKSGNQSTVDIIPLVNGSSAMTITAEVELYSVDDFDEVSGQIELSTSVTFAWFDEIVQAVTGLSNSVVFIYSSVTDTLLVSYDKIWTPKIVLDNSISSEASIGASEYMCRYTLSSGYVTWSPKVQIKSACSPDVTYYPFDRQTCTFSFVAWKFTSSEILFEVSQPNWVLSSLEENGEWEVKETSAATEVVNSQSYLRLSITIERKPLYFAFNIVCPVLLLSLLNLMVFWLPSESGERVGFAITCFLSFVVMLNTIMEILPRSSSPMSYLCFYIVVMMIFSALVTTLTVVQVRIFHKIGDQKIPRLLEALVRCFKCQKRVNKRNSSGVSRATVVPESAVEFKRRDLKVDDLECNSTENLPAATQSDGDPDDGDDVKGVTWPEVSRFLDLLFFLGFLGAQVFFTITFLIPIAFRA